MRRLGFDDNFRFSAFDVSKVIDVFDMWHDPFSEYSIHYKLWQKWKLVVNFEDNFFVDCIMPMDIIQYTFIQNIFLEYKPRWFLSIFILFWVITHKIFQNFSFISWPWLKVTFGFWHRIFAKCGWWSQICFVWFCNVRYLIIHKKIAQIHKLWDLGFTL